MRFLEILEREVDRRTLLKKGFGLAGLALLAGPFKIYAEMFARDGQERDRNYIYLGPEQKLNWEGYGMASLPDGHISLVPYGDDGFNLFITAQESSYILRPVLEAEVRAKAVLQPDKNATFGRDYRGFGQVLPGRLTNELIGIFHAENHTPNGKFFKASIGLTRSFDEGRSWKNPVEIQKPFFEVDPNIEKVSGTGQPSAIIKDGLIYLYYVDWSVLPTGIHLARAPLNNCDNPRSWEKYSKYPVITAPSQEAGYAALPSISFNTFLNKYLALFETNIGFCLSVSNDGISWSKGEFIFRFEKPLQQRKKGEEFRTYPSLLSPNKRTDQETGSSGFLVFAKGIEEDVPHSAVAIPFVIGAK